MEVDQVYPNENLVCRRIDSKSSENGLGEALNRERSETIDILQVIDWYPYIGIWLLTKEIPNYAIEDITLKVTCSSDPDSTSAISIIESNVVLLESPNYEGCRLWFATFTSSFPFVLEVNTRESIIDNTIVLTKTFSTSHEMVFHLYDGNLGRKTFFDVTAAHITYDNTDFFDAIQIEHGIYFFISLGFYWKFIPLNKTIRGKLNNVILSDKRFNGDITFPWNWGELISEHQTYVFIPPLEEDDSERVIRSDLFGSIPYQYKGALIMSRDSKSVVEVEKMLKGIIEDVSSSDYEFIINYDYD